MSKHTAFCHLQRNTDICSRHFRVLTGLYLKCVAQGFTYLSISSFSLTSSTISSTFIPCCFAISCKLCSNPTKTSASACRSSTELVRKSISEFKRSISSRILLMSFLVPMWCQYYNKKAGNVMKINFIHMLMCLTSIPTHLRFLR